MGRPAHEPVPKVVRYSGVTATTPALLVPPMRLGRLLSEARETSGESYEVLVQRSGLAFDAEWFQDVEAGRIPLDESLVRWLATLYGVGAGEIVPARSKLVIDLDEGLISVGARTVPVPDVARSESSRRDLVLTNYLALVYLLRGLPAGTPIPLRDVDIAVLSQALQRDPRDVRTGLSRIISAESGQIVTRASLLRRRLVVPVAGILVGLTAVGGLLLVRATDSEAQADEQPAREVDPTAVAREVPTEIDDAVILERGAPQRTR
jgi:hypothetical protein